MADNSLGERVLELEQNLVAYQRETSLRINQLVELIDLLRKPVVYKRRKVKK